MKTRKVLLVALIGISMLAGACSSGSDYVYVDPASTEELGPDLWAVTLTQQASDRTGIETTQVANGALDGTTRLVVPYSAVIYHYDGSTWTYTSDTSLRFVRAQIEIDAIKGDTAYLTSGPDVGTVVVTVGAAELYGVEFGIGK